jgi:ABC-type Fe3+-siderophore transport system permease subunit
MNAVAATPPKVVFWFRVYAGIMAAIYGLLLVVGVCMMVAALAFDVKDPTLLLIMGGLYCALGLVFAVGFALAFLFKPSPFSWVYGFVLICIGFGGCPTIATSIPLLLFWIKPETRHYFGKP